jgi:hypothetical protein
MIVARLWFHGFTPYNRPLFDDTLHFYSGTYIIYPIHDICDPLRVTPPAPPDRSKIFLFGILVSIFRGVDVEFHINSYFGHSGMPGDHMFLSAINTQLHRCDICIRIQISQ